MPTRLHNDNCRFSCCLGCRYTGFKEETYDIEEVKRDSPCIHPEAEGDFTTRTSAPMPDFTQFPNALEIATVNSGIYHAMQTRLRPARF